MLGQTNSPNLVLVVLKAVLAKFSAHLGVNIEFCDGKRPTCQGDEEKSADARSIQ